MTGSAHRAPVVAKFGGSSLATPEDIAAVADRLAGDADSARVVVVSAMGDSTDDLITLARRVSRRPDSRELDLLLATGELVSAALLVSTRGQPGQPGRSRLALGHRGQSQLLDHAAGAAARRAA